MIYTLVAFLSCTLHVRLPLLLNVHSSRGLLLVMHAMAPMAPALVCCFLTFKQFCRLVFVDEMVNPLPIHNLSWQTFRQKVQELFQLLRNNPLRTLVTLVITRGLWIPFIKYTFLYGSFGFLVALRAICYPIEFLVKKLPLRCRRILLPYLQETLEILFRPILLPQACHL